MAVVIETTLGDVTVDLFTEQRPLTCLNFLKLCKLKYYNFNLFHTIQHGFIAQTGDPSGEGTGGQSIWGVVDGPEKRYFEGEKMPRIKHTEPGLLSMVATEEGMIGSQFFFTLASDLNSLDAQHCVIGAVTEGHDVLRQMNETICDGGHRPYQDVRITHTVILEDPFNDPKGLKEPSRSPSPSAERLAGGRIAPDEELDETVGKSEQEVAEMIQEKEAKARATILEIVGDLPDAEMAPPENVLFVCKLNPVTTDDDLEIIFSRFGKIVCCEVIRDKKSGDSLQYAFIEFDNKKACEDAYFKMDNVLIDDRRIHVDFSQSVSKIKWQGKGRGVIITDGDGNTRNSDHNFSKKTFNDVNNIRDIKNNDGYQPRRGGIEEKRGNYRRNETHSNDRHNHHDSRNNRDRNTHQANNSYEENSKIEEQRHERRRSRETNTSSAKKSDKPRERERSPERVRERERTPDKSRGQEPARSKGRDAVRPREEDRMRGRDPEKSREAISDRIRVQDSGRSRNTDRSNRQEPDKSRDGDRSNRQEPDKSRDGDRSNRQEPDKSRDGDRSNRQDPDKSRDSDRSSYRQKEKEVSSDRNRDRKKSPIKSKKQERSPDKTREKERSPSRQRGTPQNSESKSRRSSEYRKAASHEASVDRNGSKNDRSMRGVRDSHYSKGNENNHRGNHSKQDKKESLNSTQPLEESNDIDLVCALDKSVDSVRHSKKTSLNDIQSSEIHNKKNLSKKRRKYSSEDDEDVSKDEPKKKKKKSSDDKEKKSRKNKRPRNRSDSSDESQDTPQKPKSKKTAKKKRSAPKKRKDSSSSSSDSSSSESSESSDDSSDSSSESDRKKRRSKRSKRSKKVVKKKRSKKDSSSSSSSDSSSSSSEDSSSSSDSSDSGHERSRKKSKNKKSVREKLIRKKAKK